MKITQNDFIKIINESIYEELNGLVDNKLEGKPKNLRDVFFSDGWTYKKIQTNDKHNIIIQCFTNNNSLSTREYLPFNELLDDINIFYEDTGGNYKAERIEPTDNQQKGEFVKIVCLKC